MYIVTFCLNTNRTFFTKYVRFLLYIAWLPVCLTEVVNFVYGLSSISLLNKQSSIPSLNCFVQYNLNIPVYSNCVWVRLMQELTLCNKFDTARSKGTDGVIALVKHIAGLINRTADCLSRLSDVCSSVTGYVDGWISQSNVAMEVLH